MRKLSLIFLITAVLTVFITGCSLPGSDPADPAVDTDNAKARVDKMAEYRLDDNVHHLLFVSHTEGWDAKACFYEKTGANNAWVLIGEYDAFIGKNGMNKIEEGDAKTPCGDFGITGAFGILPNPGTNLSYIDISPSTYACDEEGEFYNQIINSEVTGHECTGEEMFTLSPEYNYGLTTDYNSENKYPAGSAIFIHCKGQKPYTGGCVALDQDAMLTILQNADPCMRVILDEYYVVG